MQIKNLLDRLLGFIQELTAFYAELSEERVSRTVEAYRQKIVYLDDFMNGADLWDYKYRR